MNGQRDTTDILLDGALEQFIRYGFSKTSMADIAKAASVSRTSLYNHFPTKEDVFKALSARINTVVYNDVVAALHRDGQWDECILAIINARVGWVYGLLHASEFGRELINEKNRLCGGDVIAANDKFAAIVEELIAKKIANGSDSVVLTETLLQSVNGILEKTMTKSDAEYRVTLLVKLFCSGITQL